MFQTITVCRLELLCVCNVSGLEGVCNVSDDVDNGTAICGSGADEADQGIGG
jgi:hypothetical protein